MTPHDETTRERFWLTYEDDPQRRIGVRVEHCTGSASQASDSAAPFVVLCHGFKGFMDWGFLPLVSTLLAEAGFVVFSLNASGCGVGDDPLEMTDEDAFFRDTYTRQLEDIAKVRAFARAVDGVDSEREVLMGHSRGGGMAIVAAAEDPPAALVTWAAIDEADRFDEPTKKQWRADGELRVPNARTGQVHRLSLAALEDFEEHHERLNILAAAGRLKARFLAIHGREDTTVPCQAAERLAAAAPGGRSVIVELGDHALNVQHPMEADVPEALKQALAATLAHVDHLHPSTHP